MLLNTCYIRCSPTIDRLLLFIRSSHKWFDISMIGYTTMWCLLDGWNMPIIKSIIILLLYQIKWTLSLIIYVVYYYYDFSNKAAWLCTPVSCPLYTSHFRTSLESLKTVIIQSYWWKTMVVKYANSRDLCQTITKIWIWSGMR